MTKPYRPAVITFLDIMGFRERVESSTDATEIEHILSRLRDFAHNTEEPSDKFEHTRSVAFSDSIVRVRFYDTAYPGGALFQELLSLVHIQTEMMAKDILLRGGVTTGMIYFDGDLAFGPGFNRAYDLESQFANTPRVVVGPEAFVALREDKRLRAHGHSLAEDIHYIRKLIHRGDDGLWFIDYLKAMHDELDDPDLYPDLIAQHRALIIKGANSFKPGSRVFQKYLWLSSYLNDVVNRMGLPEKLVITEKDIATLDPMSEKPHWVQDDIDGSFCC